MGKAVYVGKTLLAKNAAGFVAEWTVGVRGGWETSTRQPISLTSLSIILLFCRTVEKKLSAKESS